MIEKIKTFIAKIKTRIKYNLCFRDMEYKGIAVFSMCCGIKYNDMRLPKYARRCITCPYFTPIDEGDEK